MTVTFGRRFAKMRTAGNWLTGVDTIPAFGKMGADAMLPRA